MSYEHHLRFHSMGSDVRIVIGPPLGRNLAPPSEAARREQAWVEDFAARLSRFRADSDLSALNHDPRNRVPCSPLVRAGVRAALWAAWRSSGLVDPTLVRALEGAGYARSRDGCDPAPLLHALETAPPRRPARSERAARWRQITVDDRRAVVIRPPGLEIDTGGTGKGLCADAVAHRLAPYTRYVVDCGGDLAIGGVGAQIDPFEVEIEHPLSGETIRTVTVGTGGVASSGLNVRVWRGEDGRFAHHLLDPSTGEPAWTGVVGATALAPSALEAETLAKTALLLGPAGAAAVLQEHGGLIVRDDGDVEEYGPLETVRGALVARRGRAA